MLAISNIYAHGFAAPLREAVERAGFTIRPRVSHYPGSQACRFIDFEDGPSLELIEVEDEKAYLDFVPNGMKPYGPGISLVIEEFAERDLAYFEAKHAAYRPYRLHWNFDGTDEPGKPGWDYLNFATPILRDTFLWITQVDEPRPPRPIPPLHANGVRGVTGLVFDLPARDLRGLAAILETDVRDGHLRINEVDICSRDALAESVPRHLKVSPLVAVVLETDHLEDLPRSIREGHETTFLSRPAVSLRTNDLAWDLLLVERVPPIAGGDRASVSLPAPRAWRKAAAIPSRRPSSRAE